jgi:hypothetical protein
MNSQGLIGDTSRRIGIALTVAFMAGLLVYVGIANSVSDSKSKKHQQYAATKNHQGANTTFVGKNQKPQPDQKTASKGQTVDPNESIASSTWWIAWFTAALTFATLAQVYIAYLIQRAYLSAEPQGLNPYDKDSSGWSYNWVGHVNIRNAGRLPARNVQWFIDVGFGDEWRSAFPVSDDLLDGNSNAIPPGTLLTIGSPIISGSKDTMKIDEPRDCVYVWGRVKYNNGFGWPRTANFCHRYNWKLIENGAKSIGAGDARYHRHGNDTT